MREPHVRFCERHGGAISRAYSTHAQPPAGRQEWRRTSALTVASTAPRLGQAGGVCLSGLIRFGGGSSTFRAIGFPGAGIIFRLSPAIPYYCWR
jgi:hypothetical protein